MLAGAWFRGGCLDPLGRTAKQEAAIYNAAYMVRHYQRGGVTSLGREARAQAIQRMGEVVREAFAEAEAQDFERLLVAVVNALSKEAPPPF